jgi:ElaB/YqjD/DUF883 family membrane-anchored ribosome-binding protein
MAPRNLEQDVDALAQSLDEIRASLAKLTDALGATAVDAVAEGRSRAEAAATAARVRAEDAAASLTREIEARPLTSVAAAFLLGVIAGKLVVR